MTKILIDQEGLRSAAQELRMIDQELDAVRSRLRGAALGAMPPEVIAQIASTAARTDPRLGNHGERLCLEAGRLDWRAAFVEADPSDPRVRSSLEFVEGAGLLGLGALAGVIPMNDHWAASFGLVNDVVGGVADIAYIALYPRHLRVAPLGKMLRLAGNQGGSRIVAFARLSVRYVSLRRPPAEWTRRVHLSPGTVSQLGTGLRFVSNAATVADVALTARSVYQEHKTEGASDIEAGSAAFVVAGTSALFALVGTRFAGPVGGPILGAVGAQVGHGLLDASDAVSDALVEPYIQASEAIEDLKNTMGKAADGAAETVGDVADHAGALASKVKFW